MEEIKKSELSCGCKDHDDEIEISRRKFLSISMALSAGLIFSKFGFAKTLKTGNSSSLSFMNPLNAKAEAVIVLWMAGGPSQFETFSPKPGSKNSGITKSIKTRVSNIEIAQHLPQLADQMDKISLIRTLSSKEGNHNRASYLMHTSYPPVGVVKHPSFGGITAKELGGAKEFDLPYFISITGPSYSAEFLGRQYSPYFIKDVNKPLENIDKFGNVNDARFDDRINMLYAMDDSFYKQKGLDEINDHKTIYEKSVKMMKSPLIKSFDISEEPDALKAAYGDTNFGKGCLMARRLIETGVKFVEVTLDGWDTHVNNFDRTTNLCGTLDPAFATLIKDLSDRGMLDKTLVLCVGEFGRTPNINTNDGRDHFPDAFSCALAGGGIQTGKVIGETNEDGNKIDANPIPPENLFATMCQQLGIDYNKVNYSPSGRPLKYINSGSVIEGLV
jgi:hypothetical protein